MKTTIAAFENPKNKLSDHQLTVKHGIFYLILKNRLRDVLSKKQTHQSV